MVPMTLKELCKLMRKYENNRDKCEHFKNEFIVENHDNFKYEELAESDIAGLRPYVQCILLSFYECIAEMTGNKLPGWFSKYDGIYCSKEENDYYLALVGMNTIFDDDSDETYADEAFDMCMKTSIEPFKKRGICRNCLDDSV